MVTELRSGRNNNEAEGWLFTEQSRRGIPGRGNRISKGRLFGKRENGSSKELEEGAGGCIRVEQVGADHARTWVFILRAIGSLLRLSKQGGEMTTVV